MLRDHLSPQIRSVLVIGNNHISSSILRALSELPNIKITLLTSAGQTPFLPPSVPANRIEHRTTGSIPRYLHDIPNQSRPDLVISTANGGDHDAQIRIIDATIAAEIPRFIPAEFGQDTLNPKIQDRLPPSKGKARVLEHLRQKADEGRIEYVGIATGVLIDQKLSSGDLGFDLKWQSATIHGKGDERFAASTLKWVGDVVAAAVQRWDARGVKNEYSYAAELTTTAHELVECLEAATGKPWGVGHIETEECVREAEKRIQGGWPDAGMFLMERSVLYDESLGAALPFRDHDATGVLGLEHGDVKAVVSQVVHDFTHHGKGDCGCG
ncbi:hypothetical protein LTR66_008806 [Elasticomyces elasticus]|nr:hypothetical protein LTR66_008806 [Elasticomyces elasticus]